MNFQRHRTSLLAVAGTALALSLTACQSDDASGEPAPAATSSATGKAADGGQAGTSGTSGTKDAADPARAEASKGSTDSGGSGGSAGSTGGQATAAARACTARDVTVTATTQGGAPYTHLVLTAKNTSGRSCRLAGAPHIQFLESHKQDVPAVAWIFLISAGQGAFLAAAAEHDADIELFTTRLHQVVPRLNGYVAPRGEASRT
ncbi:DUF4232 domain-containing protein [Streptomyces sp. NPDC004011]